MRAPLRFFYQRPINEITTLFSMLETLSCVISLTNQYYISYIFGARHTTQKLHTTYQE